MKIVKALFSPGKTGFFFDDQKAIKAGASHDGFNYVGDVVTPGFNRIRMAGESVSIMFVLEDGSIAVGDAAAVQYSGTGGRDPLFLADSYIPFLNEKIRPLFEGREITTFKSMAEEMDAMEFDGKRLHTAVRYGLSQALLDATALSRRKIKSEVVCEDYGFPVIAEPVPIFGQCGDDRYNCVDKMILKEIDVLPHGLINNIPEKLGYKGEKLKEYVAWLRDRIRAVRADDSFTPDLHIDVYGTIGLIFDHNVDKIADYMADLGETAGEFNLYIEGPVDVGEKKKQVEEMAKIRRKLQSIGSNVKTVADEWCNTYEDIVDFTDADACDMVQIKTPDLGSIHNIVESIIYCKKNGMEAYQGGTCNETDVSARTCVHVGMAARAERMLAKPGMGFDEGFCIVNNEMQRILAVLRSR